jgi:nucleotide-binding universal stress UspA family protein
MYKRILMPTDGSDCSEEAISHGLELAKALGAEVTFLYVLDPLPPAISAEAYSYAAYAESLLEDLRKAAQDALERGLARAAEAGVMAHSKLKERTRPADGIVATLGDYDLVVMGSHGRSGVGRLLLGSVTEGVIRRSERPVLVVRCAERS